MANLNESERADVRGAIEKGSYAYTHSRGYHPDNGTVIEYNDTYYLFEIEGYIDKPVKLEYTLKETDSESCVTITILSLEDSDISALRAAHKAEGEANISPGTASALWDGGYDFVVIDSICYEVPSRPGSADETFAIRPKS